MIYQYVLSVPAALWPYFAPTWTRIKYDYSADGVATKCYATYTSKLSLLWHPLLHKWLTTAFSL
jgi:hypothetical protein